MAVCGYDNGECSNEKVFNFNGLSDLIYERVLCNVNRRKFICAEGKFVNREEIAVFFVEKTPISCATVKQICVPNSSLEKQSAEGKCTSYQCFPEEELNGMKMMLIFPATQKHIAKYEFCPSHIVEETPELYRKVTLPYITSESFNLQWVYNIFDHVAETESIIYEDEDSETGFLLIPDFKWDKKRIDNLHILALVKPRNIKSIRDLDTKHLPLLRNINRKGPQVIQELFGLGKNKLRIYFHYQPSYHHLHVHFTNVEYEAPGGTGATKAHLLELVIRNIELIPDYYQKATLSYLLKENDGLYKFARKNDSPVIENLESQIAS